MKEKILYTCEHCHTDYKNKKEAEYHILNNVSTQWKWIARDEDGSLFLYDKKPYKYGSFWKYKSAYIELDIYKHLFPCMKWGDDEPWEIAQLLERYENAQGE